jgi:Cu+-exporting ATPase
LSAFVNSGSAVVVALLFTAPFLLHMLVAIPILHEPLLQAVCASIACAIGLIKFVPSALGSLRAKVPNMEVLICIGIFASLGYSFYGWAIGDPNFFGFFESAAMISTLVLVGGWLERKVGDKARSAIKELAKLQPQTAIRVVGDARQPVSVESLMPGDIVAVNTGDRFPCDGEIVSGSCSVDESIATGESAPNSKGAGAKVIAGTVVVQGSVLSKVTAKQTDSFVASMVNLVRRAQTEKPPIARTADRIAAVFVPGIIALSLLTLLGSLLAGLGAGEAITRAVAVLVVACPCALGLATPAAVMIGIGRGAKRNILFRSGAAVEALARVEAIAFDKTGTLTTRAPVVTFKQYGNRYSIAELQGVAVALERHSSHPLATAILAACEGVPAVKLHDVAEQIGVGVRGVDEAGAEFFIGRSDLAADRIAIARSGELIGAIETSEALRAGAREALAYLKANSLSTLVLSGDTQARAEQLGLASEVTVFGGQSPTDKQTKLLTLNKRAAFVGDGVNDAPVLASAAVGISISEANSVAINTADVVLVGESLRPLVTAHRLSRETLATIKQNLFWAFSYNIVAIPIAMAGMLSPAWAAMAMGFSDVILVLNSLRLKFKRID